MGKSSALLANNGFTNCIAPVTTRVIHACEPPPLAAAARQLAHLNRQFIALLAIDGGLPDAVMSRLHGLSGNAAAAMADCPFSLFTLGFDDARRWLSLLAAPREPAPEPAMVSAHFRGSVIRTEFAAAVIFFAWHLAHSDPLAGKILLELDADVATALRRIPIAHLRTLANSAAQWIAPRWPQNRYFWPELVLHACDRDSCNPDSCNPDACNVGGDALRATKLLGRQLLAAESLARLPQRNTTELNTIQRRRVPAIPFTCQSSSDKLRGHSGALP